MDKNTITGFVLMALVLFGFAWWQQPSDEEIAQQRIEFVKDSIANAQKIAEQRTQLPKQPTRQTKQVQILQPYSTQHQKALQRILY